MKSLIGALLFALVCGYGVAQADPTPVAPWDNAQAALDAATQDMRSGGLRAMSTHVAAFEEALTTADKPYDDPAYKDKIVLLVDGMMDQAAAQTVAEKAFPGKKVDYVADPYATMALYLGSYYNEVGRYADALRVLEAQKARTMGTFGDHAAGLTSERAVALGQLHRNAEALAVYDEGLKLDNINDKGKARMHRGRGYALTEMDRLDEAEAAYQESLKFEPGNKVALGELEYIAKLKTGGAKTPGGITLPNPPGKN